MTNTVHKIIITLEVCALILILAEIYIEHYIFTYIQQLQFGIIGITLSTLT